MAEKKSKKSGVQLLFSEQLRAAIEASELTQYRIAKESGIARSSLSQFMTGKRSMSLANIDAIIEVLDLKLTPRK
jgi:transcriptional regulator with XRE-family HTH domain